jgi:hypothetical protein
MIRPCGEVESGGQSVCGLHVCTAWHERHDAEPGWRPGPDQETGFDTCGLRPASVERRPAAVKSMPERNRIFENDIFEPRLYVVLFGLVV